MEGSFQMKFRMNVISVFLILFFSFSNLVFAHEEVKVNPIFENQWSKIGTIKADNIFKTFEFLHSLNIDIAGVDHDAKLIDVLISDIEYDVLTRRGVNVELSSVVGIMRGPDEEYKNPEEIEEILSDFATRFPAITKKVSIGKSLEGRDIWAIKISDNAATDEVNEPSVLFNSMHHAREVMSPEASLDIIETLVTNYGQDGKITNWVDSAEIWVLPMLNVDGNVKMWNYDKWWRKNTRGGYGVDLNRNYPSGWNKCQGSSGAQDSQTYRGPNPASEPETQAMMKFVEKIRPVFDISYHSYSEMVIYPKGCKPERASTADVVEKIGKEVAQKLRYKAGTAWELLYNADGGDIDWMYDAYQVIPFVIELNSRWQGFHPRYRRWRDKTVERNRAGWQHLLERLSGSGIRGQLTNNQKAVSDYTIDIYKVDKTNRFYQTYVGHNTGMYHLVLNPGNYELQFKVNNQVVKKVRHTVGSSLSRANVDLSL